MSTNDDTVTIACDRGPGHEDCRGSHVHTVWNIMLDRAPAQLLAFAKARALLLHPEPFVNDDALLAWFRDMRGGGDDVEHYVIRCLNVD